MNRRDEATARAGPRDSFILHRLKVGADCKAYRTTLSVKPVTAISRATGKVPDLPRI
jgi:hypothetical protein